MGTTQERTSGHTVTLLSHLGDRQVAFPGSCSMSQPLPQRVRVPAPPPFPTPAVQFMSQAGCGGLSSRLIRIALKPSGIECLSMFLSATHMPSLVQCLFRSFARFQIGLFDFLCLSCESSLCITNVSLLSEIRDMPQWVSFCECLFTFLMVLFEAQWF